VHRGGRWTGEYAGGHRWNHAYGRVCPGDPAFRRQDGTVLGGGML